jgi:tetratricopeptide (TPR) repeat protein
MEYVDGRSIDAYCDANALDLSARIRLFLRICSAVAAAHRALVVHRDLKPSNVLVTAAGDVKLLDFGIAKLLTPVGWSTNADTAPDARLLTPAYASPEQVLGQPVSTATDVYALGLLLYELLCGRRAHRWPSDGVSDLTQVVVRGDPLPMSAAVKIPDRVDAAPAAAIAAARQTTVPRLARQLRGDLERITSVALRKDPDARYATAAQLAEDLQRYLDGRPINARGHSMPYRAARFARRHRVALVAMAMIVAVLAGYLAMAIKYARDMEQAAARERSDAARAREVADYVVGLFEVVDPDRLQNSQLPVVPLLEEGLARADTLSTQPLLQARLLNAIGRVYFSRGQFDIAETVAARALEASRRGGGGRHPDVARDQRLLGLSIAGGGRHHEAAELFRAALDIRRATEVPNGVECATDQHHLGYALAQAGMLEEGERHVAESLERRRAVLPAGHEDIATSLSGLAWVRARQGRPHEAVDLYREALHVRVARLGERHPEVARARQNLASMLGTAGALDEASREMKRALEVYRAVYGARHPSIATALNNLGLLESRRRHDRDAVRYTTASFEMRLELLGPDHPATLLSQSNLASLLGRVGRTREGELMLREVLHRTRDQPALAVGITRPQALANLAHLLRLQMKLAEAETVAREALAAAVAEPVNPLNEASIRLTLAMTLADRGRLDEAIPLAERAAEIRRDRLGADHPDVRRTQTDLDALRARARRRSTPAPR